MVVDYHAIGRRVKAARLRCGITQEVLAERTGLSLPHISNIETGNTKLSLPAMIHVANALSVSVDTLLCDNVKQAKVVFEAELQQLLSDCTTEEMRVLVGPRSPVPPDGTKRAITSNGATVGWVIASPVERLTRNTDINFDRQQRQTSWLIVALSTLLAALATFPLARGLLAPVKRLVEGTHKLAAGDFTTRVDTRSQDELGKLAQDFNQLASTLEKNQQMRRDFMADIAHELRTPLAVLRGELEAIQDGVRQFTPESVASLQAEVGTLTKLVDDLHQLSMSDEGALAYQKAPVDVINVLEVASGAFRERFASRNLKIDLSLPDSAVVFGDKDRLMQLFNNLLENSLRYTDSGGGLHISGRQDNGRFALTFADSAPGVQDAQLEKLFERFYRTEGSRNRASGGSGLGLAICVNIVEAHNGTIRAAHSPFGGVSITVELPLERDLSREA